MAWFTANLRTKVAVEKWALRCEFGTASEIPGVYMIRARRSCVYSDCESRVRVVKRRFEGSA